MNRQLRFPLCATRRVIPVLFLPLFLFLFLSLSSQQVRIRIVPPGSESGVTFQALSDEVIVLTGDSFPVVVTRLQAFDRIELKPGKGRVSLIRDGGVVAEESAFRFFSQDSLSLFRLFTRDPKVAARTYPGDLVAYSKGNSLFLVDECQTEDYLPGVVHSEAGHHLSLEFFKVQAVAARTYALNNLGRHAAEGFGLCDNPHCQAFNGLNDKATLVAQAVQETRGEVIVWADTLLIDAVFSANCGGYTANSEDVWIRKVEYLRAVSDETWCEGSSSHAWHRTMTRWDFLLRLGRYYKREVWRYEIIPDISGRVRRIILNDDPRLAVSGEELRKIFSIRSAKFHVYESRDMVILEGEGFGHGVGMCQDGAWQLANSGMDYVSIIRHYYQGVSLRPYVSVRWPRIQP